MNHKFLDDLFDRVIDSSSREQLEYRSTAGQFESNCFALKCHYPYLWLLDINAYEIQTANVDFCLKYSFYDADQSYFFSIIIDITMDISKKYHIESLGHLWKSASVFEQEIAELFEVFFSRSFERQYTNDNLTDKASFDFDYQISLKSSFQTNHNKVLLNLSGTKILECQVERGNYHLGLEKIMENTQFNDLVVFFESYFPKISPFCSIAMCMGAEAEQNITIPDRAQAIRMATLEINRIMNHLCYLKDICRELSLESGYIIISTLIKKIQALIVSYSGNEFGHFFSRVGGVTRDVHQDWVSRTINELHTTQVILKQLKMNLFDSRTNALKFSFPIITKHEASAWNLTGPLARATGLHLDFRKSHPFYFYRDVEFSIPVGVNGTGHDLIDIRFEEIFQSIRIVGQVLDNLPTGQILCDSFNELFSDKESGGPADEALYKQAVSEFQKVENLNQALYLEGPDGLLGLDLLIKNHEVSRCHFFTPARLNKRVFEIAAIGMSVDEISPYWTSFGINLKEAER